MPLLGMHLQILRSRFPTQWHHTCDTNVFRMGEKKLIVALYSLCYGIKPSVQMANTRTKVATSTIRATTIATVTTAATQFLTSTIVEQETSTSTIFDTTLTTITETSTIQAQETQIIYELGSSVSSRRISQRAGATLATFSNDGPFERFV